MNNKEKVIKFLIDKYNSEDSNDIKIYKSDIEKLNINDKEAAKILLTLNDSKLISIKAKSIHNDFNMFWYVTILPSSLEYFDKQKHNKVSNKREWVRTYIPIMFSSISIIISIISLLITMHK